MLSCNTQSKRECRPKAIIVLRYQDQMKSQRKHNEAIFARALSTKLVNDVCLIMLMQW